MTLLLIAVAALLIGPLLAKIFERQPGVNRFLDGFILVSIGGIAIVHLLPEAVVQIGGMALLMVILGALCHILQNGHFIVMSGQPIVASLSWLSVESWFTPCLMALPCLKARLSMDLVRYWPMQSFFTGCLWVCLSGGRLNH